MHFERLLEESSSPAMRLAIERGRLYAVANRPVLLVGPVGSGKTTLARLIHRWSGRTGQFVTVASGSLSETLFRDTLFGHVAGAYTGARSGRSGAFERAAGGTVFFDDLTYLPLPVQSSLLQVVESRSYLPLGGTKERHVSARELYASTESADSLTRSGKLIPDLSSRLGELVVELPPLRERRGDIMRCAAAVAGSFLEEHTCEAGVQFSEEVRDLLVRYTWPGNLRELRSVTERALLHAGLRPPLITILPAHLPERVRHGGESNERPNLTADLVRHVLEETGGNQSEAARRLGVHRNTISRYIL